MKKDSYRYISELRKRIIAVAAFFIAILLIGLAFSKQLVILFLSSNIPDSVNLVTLNPYENISLFISIVFFLALVLTIPFALYHIIAYIKPCLTKKEKMYAVLLPLISLFLFILGAGFGYFSTNYLIIPFLSNLTVSIGVMNNWSIYQFMKFVVYLSLVFGLIFQMPLIISLLVKFNLLTPERLTKLRKHIIIGLLVLVALITPPDLLSLVIMSIPLIILLEITIIIAKFIKRKEGT